MVYLVTNQQSAFRPEGYSLCTVQQSLEYLNNLDQIGYDSETRGFDPYTKELLSIQLGDENKQFVIDCSTVNPSEYKNILESKELIMQNAKFDLRFLYHYKIVPEKIYDTFLCERILTTGIDTARRSLDVLVYKYCKIELDKTIRGNIHREGLSTRVIKYAADDIKYLSQIKRKQFVKLKENGLSKTASLDNEFVKVLAYIEYCGMYLNIEDWKKKCQKDLEELDKIKKKLDTFIIENASTYSQYITNQLSLFDEGIFCTINWNSPKQVLGFLQSLGINTETKDKETGLMKHSTDKKVLEPQKDKHPIIPIFIEYGEHQKVVSTYGLNWLDYINPVTKRIHSNFTQIMNTGRLSSGQKGNKKKGLPQMPNMQNIPANERTRHCFQSEKGRTLVVSDYSGQEQIVLANKSLDPNLLLFYSSGESDMHSFVSKEIAKASNIFPKEMASLDLKQIKNQFKEERQKAKSAGFAINYGGTGITIAQNLNISKKEGEEIYEAYLKAFPGLKEYFKKEKRKALEMGYIQFNEISRRKCFIPFYEDWVRLHKEIYEDRSFWDDYKREKSKNSYQFNNFYKPKVREYFMKRGDIERMSLNYPIQGSSADITKLACIYFFRYLESNNLIFDVLLPNVVHDEIIAECRQEIAEEIKNKLKECMEKAGDVFCKTVKLKADPVISHHWEH